MAEAQNQPGWRVADGFALDSFLARPLVARVATIGRDGPTIRPVWYVWEEQRFWWLTGSWSSVERQLRRDPRVALVVDSYDAESGEIRQVIARGPAHLAPFDPERARRWGRRYMGPEESDWGRFREGVFENPSTRFVALEPASLVARDLSF
jgi:nitroimidazol reductase NimA-like FMN-containing flavoprotein (pyridoxamine 5'-phosphate oxidase superfamily)